jgi:Fe-S cluster assembly protein SufD
MTQLAETTAAAPLGAARSAAQAAFSANGLPAGKEEAFRFTKIAPIVRTQFAAADEADGSDLARRYSFGADAVAEVVFVNGRYAAELSQLDELPRGLTISTLTEAAAGPAAELLGKHLGTLADPEKHPFVAYNGVNFVDGVFLHIARGATIEKPIHLLFISRGESTPAAAHPRVLAVIEDNAEATLVESYVGSGEKYLTNAVTEIVCGQDCRIDHCKLQQESTSAFHTAAMNVVIGRQTQFVSQAINVGALVSRNDLSVKLDGPGAYATLNGLVLLEGEQHCDNHTLLDHAKPDCPSHELYKHVLADSASAVFKGQIYVNQMAQRTNAKQSSKSLLLSDKAMMNSMPALEIYADDVKCTHGSTIGPIDEDMVFYARSRGISDEAARHLLTYAFAADVTRRIKVAPVRRRIENVLAARHGLPQDIAITDLGEFDEAAR